AGAEEEGGAERPGGEEGPTPNQVEDEEPGRDHAGADQTADDALADDLVLADGLPPGDLPGLAAPVQDRHERHARQQVAREHLGPAELLDDVHAGDRDAAVEDA